jgi:hypothetical protein
LQIFTLIYFQIFAESKIVQLQVTTSSTLTYILMLFIEKKIIF